MSKATRKRTAKYVHNYYLLVILVFISLSIIYAILIPGLAYLRFSAIFVSILFLTPLFCCIRTEYINTRNSVVYFQGNELIIKKMFGRNRTVKILKAEIFFDTEGILIKRKDKGDEFYYSRNLFNYKWWDDFIAELKLKVGYKESLHMN